MHSHEKRRGWNVLGSVCQAVVLLAVSISVNAAEKAAAAPQFQVPFGFKQYHLRFDVNADGSYKELAHFEMEVLNEQGIQTARRMGVGTQTMPVPVPDRDVHLVTAYTLKKNGEHIAATSVNPPTAKGLPHGTAPVPNSSQTGVKFVTFQLVEIGDTLVLSYQATQKKPLIPNNFVLDQMLPKSAVYGDVQISISAPAAMNLRVESLGGEVKQSTSDGNVKTWEWKYQNKSSAVPSDNQPPIARLHISTFKDVSAEMEALNKLRMASLPPVQSAQPVQRCPVLAGIPNDGQEAQWAFTASLADNFWRSADTLKQEVNDWNIPTCVFADGRPRLSVLLDGYDHAFKRESDWSKSLARLDYLKKVFPNQAFVALAEARYWTVYAWNARGTGYADSVSNDGWKLFRERLEKAERILIETKSYSADLPAWYVEMIIVQSALGRPEDARDQVFMEGVKRYPTFYPIYFTMQSFLSPKWGGSWRTVDNLVQWSIEHTPAEERDSMYARLYWAVSGDFQVNLFKDTFASWPKMKRGFDDLMARYPKSKWNLNNFAKFACIAGDKQAFLRLRKQIGKDVIDAAWPQNTSLDLCETKFGRAE